MRKSRRVPAERAQPANDEGQGCGIFEGEADALVRRAVDQGLNGDLRAIRLILDRLEPAPKDRAVDFEMPPVNNAQDSIVAYGAISSAVARGELTPLEAKSLSTFLDRHVRAIELADLEARLGSRSRPRRRRTRISDPPRRGTGIHC